MGKRCGRTGAIVLTHGPSRFMEINNEAGVRAYMHILTGCAVRGWVALSFSVCPCFAFATIPRMSGIRNGNATMHSQFSDFHMFRLSSFRFSKFQLSSGFGLLGLREARASVFSVLAEQGLRFFRLSPAFSVFSKRGFS